VFMIVDSISEGDVRLGFGVWETIGVEVGCGGLGEKEEADMGFSSSSDGWSTSVESRTEPSPSPEFRLESLLQNESLLATIFAIGELILPLTRESSEWEFGVEAPEFGAEGVGVWEGASSGLSSFISSVSENVTRAAVPSSPSSLSSPSSSCLARTTDAPLLKTPDASVLTAITARSYTRGIGVTCLMLYTACEGLKRWPVGVREVIRRRYEAFCWIS
jgi:hypothetical protein